MKKGDVKNITKKVLVVLLYTGAIGIACTSPYFVRRAFPIIIRKGMRKVGRMLEEKKDKPLDKQYKNTFYYLKKKGLIKMESRKGQIYISLTKEGKERANKYQIDELEIKKPRKWDKKWRILIFDISDKHRIKREALRGKIKELGLFQLQKSVWVCPYDFIKEAGVLRDFFGLTDNEMQVITATKIENDQVLKMHFRI